MSMRIWRFSALLAAGLVAGQAQAATIGVEVDRAKILRLDQPAAMVVIGNPMIADASIQNGNMLVLTGRSYGATNMIILDDEGREIANDMIEVKRPNEDLLTVHRGTARASYTCTPVCERTLMLGDAQENFDSVNGQISSRNSLSTSSSN